MKGSPAPMSRTPAQRRSIAAKLLATVAVFGTLAVGLSACSPADSSALAAGDPQTGGNLVYLDAEIPFGAQLQERTLVAGAGARLDKIRFGDWLAQPAMS